MSIYNILKQKKKLLIISLAIVICISIFIVFLIVMLNTNDEFKVKFYSDDKSLLKIDTVTAGNSATPPVNPEMTYGNVFQKWDKDFTSVSNDLEINPVFESVKSKENVFALAGTYGKKNDFVTTSLTLCGNVELSGFDITVQYDKDALLLDSVFDNDANVIYNEKELGKINLNFVSIENATADVDICSFKFKINDNKKESPLTIKVNKVYANKGSDLYLPKYNIINSNIYVY